MTTAISGSAPKLTLYSTSTPSKIENGIDYKKQAEVINTLLYGSGMGSDYGKTAGITDKSLEKLAENHPEGYQKFIQLISKGGDDNIGLSDEDINKFREALAEGWKGEPTLAPEDLAKKLEDLIKNTNTSESSASSKLIDISQADTNTDGQINIAELIKATQSWLDIQKKVIPFGSAPIESDIKEIKTDAWVEVYEGNLSAMFHDMVLVGPLLGALPKDIKNWGKAEIENAKKTLAEVKDICSKNFLNLKSESKEARLKELIQGKSFSRAGIRAFSDRISEKISKDEIKNAYGAFSYSINTGLVNDGNIATSSLADITNNKYTWSDIFAKFAEGLANPDADYSFIAIGDKDILIKDKNKIYEKMKTNNNSLFEEINNKLNRDLKGQKKIDKYFEELIRVLMESGTFTNPAVIRSILGEETWSDKFGKGISNIFGFSEISNMPEKLGQLFERISNGEASSLAELQTKAPTMWKEIQNRAKHDIKPIENGSQKVHDMNIAQESIKGLKSLKPYTEKYEGDANIRQLTQEVIEHCKTDEKLTNVIIKHFADLGMSVSELNTEKLLEKLYAKASENENISYIEDVNRVAYKMVNILDSLVNDNLKPEEFTQKVDDICMNRISTQMPSSTKSQSSTQSQASQMEQLLQQQQ